MKKTFNFFMQLWTASIRRQLMMGIILVHAVLMSIFVFDLVERQRVFLHVQSLQQAKSLSETLAVNSSSWVLANDVVGLEEVMNAQNKYPGLRSAMVLDTKGRILGHTEVDKVGLYLNDAISAKILTSDKEQIILINNSRSIDVAAEITSNGILIGWARVNLTQDENSKNLQIITRDGILYTILAIAIGALFAFFMARGITQGLKQIVDVAEGIKLGNQTLRANVSRHDEIGTLGKDFNIMLDTIGKSKRDLQAIMDNSSAVIYAKDLEGRYLFINKQWMSLFALEKKDIVGKTDHELFENDFAVKFRENDLAVLKAGHALSSEEVAPQVDGMHTYITVKFPLLDESGEIYAVCGISTDISERIEIENEKSALESQLFHTQKMQAIGQLTGGIAHDFNNILAVILGYTELSKERFGNNNESLNVYLNEMETAGIRGRELIKQMMIYSRKDRSQNDLVAVKTETILEETVSMLKATFPAGINIETLVEKNIPNVMANSSLLSQVLMNLCINAKDSMGKEGKLLIAIKFENFKNTTCDSCHEQYSGDFIVINIKDNGSGIDEEALKRIFEPFFTTKQVGEGTGMGLSVVHGVVHKLGGHILVDSIVGKGTSFRILLPASKKEINVVKNEVDKNIEYDFSDLNIMVVDDEPAVASLLEASLERCRANVNVFNDSQLALAFFEEDPSKVDFVITDQTMPNLTGINMSEKLLALRPDIKIILCTGHSVDVTEESALELGVKYFIYKPVKMTEINKVINKLR